MLSWRTEQNKILHPFTISRLFNWYGLNLFHVGFSWFFFSYLNSKPTCTGIIVDVVRQRVHDVAQSLHQNGIGKTLLQRELEHLEEGSQRVLVHDADLGHLSEYKEEDGASFGGRAVAITQLINVHSGLGGQLEFVANLRIVNKLNKMSCNLFI